VSLGYFDVNLSGKNINILKTLELLDAGEEVALELNAE
jgi:hypothetical protein